MNFNFHKLTQHINLSTTSPSPTSTASRSHHWPTNTPSSSIIEIQPLFNSRPALSAGGGFLSPLMPSLSFRGFTQLHAVPHSYLLCVPTGLWLQQLLFQVNWTWVYISLDANIFAAFRITVCPASSLSYWIQEQLLMFSLSRFFPFIRMRLNMSKFFTYHSWNWKPGSDILILLVCVYICYLFIL